MGNGTDTDINTDSGDGVKADTKSTSQDEKLEVVIDADDGNQEKPRGMTLEQTTAAFHKEKDKRKRKNQELEEQKKSNEKLQETVSSLQETVGQLARGKRPELSHYDTDEDYESELQKWYENKPPEKVKPKEVKPEFSSDKADFYLFQKEQELKSKVDGYDEAKDGVRSQLSNIGVEDPDAALSIISTIAMEADVDVAKAILAIDKIPSLLTDIKNAGGSQIKIAAVLKDAASRIKPRKSKDVDTDPDPDINNSGSVGSSNVAVAKALKAWQADSSVANYQKLQAASNN